MTTTRPMGPPGRGGVHTRSRACSRTKHLPTRIGNVNLANTPPWAIPLPMSSVIMHVGRHMGLSTSNRLPCPQHLSVNTHQRTPGFYLYMPRHDTGSIDQMETWQSRRCPVESGQTNGDLPGSCLGPKATPCQEHEGHIKPPRTTDPPRPV